MAPAGAPTTITNLSDDLVREIFLHLPDLPCLVRAAFACVAFRRAVRSSPAFRRIFLALRAPPLLALFVDPSMDFVPAFPSPWRRSDTGLPNADFFGTGLSSHGDPGASGLEIQSWEPSTDGYLNFLGTRSRMPRAAYSPLRQALALFTHPPDSVQFYFYTLSSEDGQGPSRVVCVCNHEYRCDRITAVIFSSDSMEWQMSRKATSPLLELEHFRITSGMVVAGLICWRGWISTKNVVFDTTTCQFSLIDLPMALKKNHAPTYKLGETSDGKFCIVDIKEETIVSWFMTASDDGVVKRWMMYKKFPLDPIVKEFTGCSMHVGRSNVKADIVAVIKGFVYLSIIYFKDTDDFEMYLSLCLETSEICELFNYSYRYGKDAHPYIMEWPPSLLQSKEESETEFTGDSVAGDLRVCADEASNVLVTSLKSFRQALMNDSDINKEIVAEFGDLLGHTLDDEGSIIRKMATVDAQLRTARDRILRIRT